MPSITLTPSACTGGTGGWINLYYHSTDNSAHYPRQLIFTFPANATLGGAGINITGITLHAYVRNSASAVKQLRFGCKTGAGAAPTAWAQVNGANVLDGAFTAVGHGNGSYIYRYVARALSGAALERFAAHMQARFAAGQALYLGVVQPEDGKSIQVNTALGNWAIDVTYELLGNVPSANVNTATLGSTAIKTTLNKVIAGSSTTIRYKIGSQTIHTQDVGTGASHTYTVPTSAGQYFPNAQRATLTIAAETFVGGTSYGTVSTSVTLNLPSDAAPTATCAPSRTWVSGVSSGAKIAAYVQQKSGINFSLNGSAKYGASIASYRLTIENKTYTRTGNGSIAHSPIAGSGAIAYSYTVTDSRGLAHTYTSSLTVLAWRAPQIANFAVERVTSANESAIDGTYARVTVQATASTLPVDGAQKNSLTYYVRYRQTGASAWTNGDTTTVTGGISANRSFMLQKSGANVGTFDDLTGYDFQLVISDIYASSTASSSMPTKTIVQHVRKPNGSMGFGGEATGTGSTPTYDFYGPINARNGVIGGTRYSTSEVDTGNNWIDGKRIYARMIAITTPATLNASTTFNLNMGGMDTAWIDPSASFLKYSDTGAINHLGYVASDGGRQFMAQLQREANVLYIVSDGAGTGYVRVLYTKN